MSCKIPIKDQTKIGVAKDVSPLWWRPLLSWQEYMNTAFCHFISAFTPSVVWDADETGFHMMEKHVNRLCSDLYNAYRFPGWAFGGAKFEPDIDIIEHEADFLIHADLPGVKPDDLDLALTYESLRVAGCRCEEDEEAEKEGDFLHRERYCRAFDRTIALPEEVEVEKATAVLDKNVLTVRLPKRYGATPNLRAPEFQDNKKAAKKKSAKKSASKTGRKTAA